MAGLTYVNGKLVYQLSPQPAEAAPDAKQQGAFADIVDYAQRAFFRGFADDAELISLAGEAGGSKMVGDLAGEFSDIARSKSEDVASTRSAAAREAEGLEFIHEDEEGNYSFGTAWFDKDAWTRLAGEGLGSLASILATGGPIAGGIKWAAKKSGGKALKEAVERVVEKDGKELLAKGMSKADVDIELARRVDALDAVAKKKLTAINKYGSMTGFGVATGVQVGGATASGVQQMVENTPFEKLNGSELYQQTFWAIKDANPNLPGDEVHAQARKQTARELSKPAAAAGFALGAITGPVFGKYIDDAVAGRVAGDILARVGKGAGVEGGTEFVEEGGQQIAQNVAVQEVLPERRITQGALPAAVEGGLGGTMAGGPTGILSGRHIDDGMTPEQRLKSGVASKRMGVEIDEILAAGEAALGEQRAQVDGLLTGIKDAAGAALKQREDKLKAEVPTFEDTGGFAPGFEPAAAAPQQTLDDLLPAAPAVGIPEALQDVTSQVGANTPVTVDKLKEMEDIANGIKAKRPKPKKAEPLPKPALPEPAAPIPAVEGLATAAPVAEGAQAPPTAGAVVSPETPTGTTMSPVEIDREAQDATKPGETGHVMVQGLPITIETPAGKPRKPGWEPLKNHYGSIKRTKGQDGEAVDVFLGANPEAREVFVVDQTKADGTFDEHKAMVGFNSQAEAEAAYKANYPADFKMGPVTAMPAPQFKAWVEGGSKQPVDRSLLTAKPSEAVQPETEVVTGPTVEDIHGAADAKGLKWDNNPEFMALTKRVTGKEHLDDLNPEQRKLVMDRINAMPESAVASTPTTLAAPATAPEVEAKPKPAPDLKTAFRLYVREKGQKGVAATQQLVDSITTGWAVKPSAFKTISTFEEAPESTRNAYRRSQERGVTDTPAAFLHEAAPGRFEVYVVNDALPDDPGEAAMEVAKNLYHEGVAHFGLRKMFGGRMDRVLAEAGRLYGDKLNAKAEQYELDLTDDAQRAKALDEVIAELMEDPANRQLPIVRRVLAAIREFLRPIGTAFGYELELTDDEIIRDFVIPARDLVIGGKASTMADRRRVLEKYGASKGPERDVKLPVPPKDTAFRTKDSDYDKMVAEKHAGIAKQMRQRASATKDTSKAAWYTSRAELFERSAKGFSSNDAAFKLGGKKKPATSVAESVKKQAVASGLTEEQTAKAIALTQQILGQVNPFGTAAKPKRAKVSVKPTAGAQRYELDHAKREANFLRWFGDSKMVNEPDLFALDAMEALNEGGDPLVMAERYSDQIMDAQGVPQAGREETWDGYSEADKVLGLEELMDRYEKNPQGKFNGKTGSPQIWFHGTANEIMTFRAKQAGAIFFSRNPLFSEGFAALSQSWMLQHFEEVLDSKQIEQVRKRAIESLKENQNSKASFEEVAKKLGYNVTTVEGLYSFNPEGTDEQFGIMDMPADDAYALGAAMSAGGGKMQETRAQQEMERLMSDDPDELRDSMFFLNALKDEETGLPNMPSGPNLMPVYLKAENPFDFEDKAHRDALEKWLREANPIDILDHHGNDHTIEAAMAKVFDGDWQMMEGRVIQEAIKDMGHDAFYMAEIGPGGSEKNIAVYKDTQVKSAVGNNGFFDPNNGDVAFRLSGHRQSWDAPEITGWDKFVYLLQDKQVDTKRVIDSIRKAGRVVGDKENVYEKETLYHGRAAKRTEDFWTDEGIKLLSDMHAKGVKLADFENFLLARQAAETNAVLRARNPTQPEPTNGWSGMSDSQAATFLRKLSASDKRSYEALAKRVDDIIAGTRKTLVEYGLETQETVDAWKKTFPNYVPLHREDMGDNMAIGQGFSVRGPASKARTGSGKVVVNILANVMQQRDQAIIRGEKNIVANSLIALAKNNENTDFWRVDDPPTIKYIDGSGVARTMVDPNFKGRRNVITARTIEQDAKGKLVVREHSVVFNEADPRAVRMSESLKNLDATEMPELMERWAKATRYFASINTQFNPVFGVINLVRDFQGAMVNLSSTPLRGQQAKVMKLVLPALRGIYSDLRAIRAGKHPTSQWAQTFEEFQREGGQTGYRDLFKTADKRETDQLEAELKKLTRGGEQTGPLDSLKKLSTNPAGAAEGLARWTFNWLSDYNSAMENAMRLAAYKTATEMKMSKQTAANIAKNLTVNFNRKGQMGRQLGVMYAFFNASTQGTARLSQTLFKPGTDGKPSFDLSETGKKVVAGGLMLGVAQALMMAAYFDDENEPPEFVRQRNFIIPLFGLGKEKDYLAIPMPLGLHVIPNLARVTTAATLGGFRDMGDRMVTLLDLIADAFNPVGNSGFSGQTIAPTVADPLVALLENRDWTGKPITKPDYTPLTPEPAHLRMKDTATWYSRFFSEVINKMSGGSDYSAGALPITPDQIDFLVDQFTGGVGRELGKLAQTTESLATGAELPTHKIPLLGRLYGSAEGQAPQGSTFYANLKKLNKHELEVKGRVMSGLDPAAYMRDSPEAKLWPLANRTEQRVQQLRRQKRVLIEQNADRDRIRTVDSLITEAMRSFNDRVKAAREGTSR